jgi:hypothetical protein
MVSADGGQPELKSSFETKIDDVHVTVPDSVHSFGSVMRFIAGPLATGATGCAWPAA